MFALLVISQTTLNISGHGGFYMAMPSEWSVYQKDNDRAVVSGPVWGFDGLVRSGQFGVGFSFFTGSYDKADIHDHETGNVREDTSVSASRQDFWVEGRFYPSDLYLAFLYAYHSEKYTLPVILDNWETTCSGSSFGLGVGFEMPPANMSFTPYAYGSVAYTMSTRTSRWLNLTDTDDGTGARFMGEVGLSYHYKPVYLSMGFMGQSYIAQFGDDTVPSLSNLWGLRFGVGADF